MARGAGFVGQGCFGRDAFYRRELFDGLGEEEGGREEGSGVSCWLRRISMNEGDFLRGGFCSWLLSESLNLLLRILMPCM